MFLFFNEENLQFRETLFTLEINTNTFNYESHDGENIQINIPEQFSQSSSWDGGNVTVQPYKRVGDCFFLKEHTTIIVYGFVHEPYILLEFLTPSIFALEFIRHKLIIENHHFLRSRKAYVADEQIQVFYSKRFKPDTSIENEYFPLDIKMFNEEYQWVISLSNQFLWLDTNKFVPDILLSLLFRLGMCQSES